LVAADSHFKTRPCLLGIDIGTGAALALDGRTTALSRLADDATEHHD
jgi:hypothetical protein